MGWLFSGMELGHEGWCVHRSVHEAVIQSQGWEDWSEISSLCLTEISKHDGGQAVFTRIRKKQTNKFIPRNTETVGHQRGELKSRQREQSFKSPTKKWQLDWQHISCCRQYNVLPLCPCKHVHSLTFWICEYITLHGKSHFADVIKVTLQMGRVTRIIQVGLI